jgi:hypothetical protein
VGQFSISQNLKLSKSKDVQCGTNEKWYNRAAVGDTKN